MSIIIKTKRLELKRLKLSDAKAISKFYIRNKEFLEAFEPLKTKAFYRLDYQRSSIKAELLKEKQGKCIKFLIYEINNPELIGMITVNEIIKGCFQSAFIGYKMDKQFINKGYMTEALVATVDYGFNTIKLHRLEANILPDNQASISVVKKVGFINEGLSKSYLKINGQWKDHYHYVLLNQ